ncbi:MAG: hypothetical protein OXR73_21455 [Myxococcales bacterium]|nr:hypothetical protein [Myxococcales bacterium]
MGARTTVAAALLLTACERVPDLTPAAATTPSVSPQSNTTMPIAGSRAPVMTFTQGSHQETPAPARVNDPETTTHAMDPEATAPDVTAAEAAGPETPGSEPPDTDPADPEPPDTDPADPERTEPGRMNGEDLGEGDGSDVVTIGDSWMYFGTSGGIYEALRRAGKRYTNHAMPGAGLLSGAGAIPDQWTTATRQNPNLKTVVMTGGGNDVVLSPGAQTDCQQGGATCKATLARISEILGKMWSDMAEAGVQDVVYIGYSTDARNPGPAAADLMMNGVQEICDAAPLNCHTLQATDIVMGQFADGVHPTPGANDRLAAAILELMEERGVRR